MKTKKSIIISEEFSSKVNNYRAVLIEADVANGETTEELKEALNKFTKEIEERYTVSDINKIPAITATRTAYKLCGKDPNRYRPSQEQMMRRIVRKLGLYNVNILVDCGNMLSLKTGCSVGCFDADKINGDVLTLGIGKADEPYSGIGRGEINIEGLPVFRDETGGIGTPTSDNERTKLTLETQHLLVTIHLFDSSVKIEEVVNQFIDIFTQFGKADNIRWEVFD